MNIAKVGRDQRFLARVYIYVDNEFRERLQEHLARLRKALLWSYSRELHWQLMRGMNMNF